MNKPDVKNEGVVVRGNATINAQQIAVGRKASITVNQQRSDSFDEVQKKLADVLAAVAAERHALSNPDQIEQSARLVAEEAVKEKPNKLTVKAILDGIATAAKSATGVATAVEALKIAVLAIIG